MGDSVMDPATARRRLLETADELFYREGIHRVTMDRLIEKAGVPCSALYEAFGSADGVIRAYLRARHTRLQNTIEGELPKCASARECIVRVFELQGKAFGEPGFRGCALVTASVEALPRELVSEAVAEYRDWIHNLFFELAFSAEAAHPEELAQQLVVLFDGAAITAWLDNKPSTVNTTRAIAGALVDAACAS